MDKIQGNLSGIIPPNIQHLLEYSKGTCEGPPDTQSPNCDISDDSDNYNEPEIIQEINDIIKQSRDLINHTIIIDDDKDNQTLEIIHDKMVLIITNLNKKIKHISDEKIDITLTMEEQLHKSKNNLVKLNNICTTIYGKYKS
jgi:hypothetical protein